MKPAKTPKEIKNFLESNLWEVQKPGRYTGGELNQVVKDWKEVNTRIALIFPDIYDLGMSNLGIAILYDRLNQRSDVLAERVFAPWEDMESILRASGFPLYSLETKHPLEAFDILGFSLPYETLYTNTLNILDLAGIPLFSKDRTDDHPLIIAGGHATFNPEPMHAFIDAFVIGEGEEVVNEIVDKYQAWKRSGDNRSNLLSELSEIWSIYIPAFYHSYYNSDGTFSHLEKRTKQVSLPIIKRITPILSPPTTRLIVPYIETVHNRISIEIMRGCTRGCRFCQAGMILRPVRERTVQEIVDAIDQALTNTGLEEVGLLSLSSSDYSRILELVTEVNNRFSGRHLTISLPSLRIESFSVDLMDALKDSRRSGYTLAPEAATEPLRAFLNKPLSDEQLLDTLKAIYSHGMFNIKLYFMIGLPFETLEDVKGIVDLCKTIYSEGRRIIGRRTQVTASVGTFIPKPHTPFQWFPMDTKEQLQIKQDLLKRNLRGPGFKLTWNSPEDSLLEAFLSRGDRRLSNVIYNAWKMGAKFEAWKEHFRFDLWVEAFSIAGLDPNFYTHRTRLMNESFPWDHINTGIQKEFLMEEYQLSQKGQTRIDCSNQCYGCGILPVFDHLRQENSDVVWKCP